MIKYLYTIFLTSLLLFLFTPSSVLHANRLDSLKVVWENQSHSDTARLKALWSYTRSRWLKCDHDSLALLGQQIYDYAVNCDYKKYQSWGLMTIGYAKLYSRDYKESENYFVRSIKIDSALGYRWMMGRKYNILAQIGKHTFDYSKGYTYLDTAFQIYEALKDTKQLAMSYLTSGHLSTAQGKYQQALSCFNTALNLSEDIGHERGIAWNRGNIADVYISQGKYDEAMQIMKKVYAYFEELNQRNELGTTYKGMGELLSKLGRYDEALEFYEKSMVIFKDYHMPDVVASILSSIGDDYLEQGRYSGALDNYNKSLKTYEDLNLKDGIANSYQRIGNLNYKLENYDQSLYYYNKSLNIFREINFKPSIAEAYGKIGEVFSKQLVYDSAQLYYEKSLEINEEIKCENAISDNCKDFGDLYKGQGDYKKAGDYYKKSRLIREKNGDIIGTAGIYAAIGELQISRNNLTEGITWCLRGFDIAVEYGLVKLEQKTSHCLYVAHKSLGNGQQALKFYELSLTLLDSLKIDNVNAKIQQMEFNRKRAEDSLAMVEENLITELAFQGKLIKEKNTRNTYMFGGFGILLIAAGLFSRMLFIRKANKELEKKNEIIAREKERAEESEKAKERFFDNVSHEFRTPLTLILGPLDETLNSSTDKDLKPDLEIMQRNALRLQGMIDELLDLSKLEFGKVKLKVKEENIVDLTQEYLQSFESLADQKNIRLKFKSESKEYLVWVDPEKIRKILTNLLSNAFKFTDEGGLISVSIVTRTSPMTNDRLPVANRRATKPGIEIKVSDTGIGIPTTKLPHIFDRFYQVNEPSQVHHAGTGIGLALTKELVELHQGSIKVESEAGKGTTFTIFFPLGKEHLSGEMISAEYLAEAVSGESKADKAIPKWVVEKDISGHVTEEEIKKKNELPTLLIAEDNIDMRAFIKTQLDNKYNILEASNGEEGLQKAIEYIPDLVISDVMMPGMDGYEMTEKLKTDPRTSHIPVIILTARASLESRLEGLETGADAYVTKPFHAKELQVRVNKLIEQRQKLREHFSQTLESQDVHLVKDPELQPMDRQFLQKAMGIVNEHISDTGFDVKTFASEMALSRVQLHRKIKALTNKTTSEFIRTIRLNRAAQLLKQHTGNVNEVAYETGFSSSSWFTRVFREQFGVSPSKYIAKK